MSCKRESVDRWQVGNRKIAKIKARWVKIKKHLTGVLYYNTSQGQMSVILRTVNLWLYDKTKTRLLWSAYYSLQRQWDVNEVLETLPVRISLNESVTNWISIKVAISNWRQCTHYHSSHFICDWPLTHNGKTKLSFASCNVGLFEEDKTIAGHLDDLCKY